MAQSKEERRRSQRDYQRKRRAENPERVKTLQAQWTENNREKTREYVRKRRAANPEAAKAYQLAYREANRERIAEADRRRRAARRRRRLIAIVTLMVDSYLIEHPEKLRKKKRKAKASQPRRTGPKLKPIVGLRGPVILDSSRI
ncbi:MAG: hypothetical protein ABUS48_00920 [Pseudomonadota bacterium]